jgi:hypothetical protein
MFLVTECSQYVFLVFFHFYKAEIKSHTPSQNCDSCFAVSFLTHGRTTTTLSTALHPFLLFVYILIFWSRFIIDVIIYFYLWCFNYQCTNSNSFTSRNGMATVCLQLCLHISITYLHYFCTNVLHLFFLVTSYFSRYQSACSILLFQTSQRQ